MHTQRIRDGTCPFVEVPITLAFSDSTRVLFGPDWLLRQGEDFFRIVRIRAPDSDMHTRSTISRNRRKLANGQFPSLANVQLLYRQMGPYQLRTVLPILDNPSLDRTSGEIGEDLYEPCSDAKAYGSKVKIALLIM